MLVVGIDVGIVHLGLVWAHVREGTPTADFEGCSLINLMTVMDVYHRQLENPISCPLAHTKTLCDRLRHFQALHHDVLEQARFIFIEQQPILGHTGVEQLLFDWYRHKTILIHPTTMHRRMGIRHLDYEHRKQATQRIVLLQSRSSAFRDTYHHLSITGERRLHDISDALCILLTGLELEEDKRQHHDKMMAEAVNQRERRRQRVRLQCSIVRDIEHVGGIPNYLEKFRHHPDQSPHRDATNPGANEANPEN